MKIIKSLYDGYFVVKNVKGSISSYEGYTLCPRRIQKMIDAGKYEEMSGFWQDAVNAI